MSKKSDVVAGILPVLRRVRELCSDLPLEEVQAVLRREGCVERIAIAAADVIRVHCVPTPTSLTGKEADRAVSEVLSDEDRLPSRRNLLGRKPTADKVVSATLRTDGPKDERHPMLK